MERFAPLEHPWDNLGGSMAASPPPPPLPQAVAIMATNSPQWMKVIPNANPFSPSGAQRDISSRLWHSVDQNHREVDNREQSLRFGSFSLGDVLEQQIRKHGQNAFHGKHYHKQSAVRFISSFTEVRDQEAGNHNHLEVEQSKQGSLHDIQNRGQVNDNNPGLRVSGSKSIYPFGTCVEDVYQT